jgi:penicillin-binding protein 1A
MTIGGLTTGVTPIDMAHAYETLAEDGRRVSGSLGTDRAGAVGISSVKIPGQPTQVNKPATKQVIPASIATTEDAIMHTVLTQGTGTAAQFGVYAAGKTGTTSNYVDAWFDGFTSKMTVAVWVGYPTRLEAMNTDFEGGPVLGGTIPALIWRDFMVRAYDIFNTRAAQAAAKDGKGTTGDTSTTQTNPYTMNTTPSDTGSTSGDGTDGAATNDTNPTGAGNQTPTGTGDQTGTGDGTANGTGPANGTGTQNPVAPTAGANAGTPATPTPGTATPTPATPVTPPASTPSPGASGGASAPSG